MKLDRVLADDLVSLFDAVVSLLLYTELTTISVLLALLESPNISDLSTVEDNKDTVKTVSLFGLDLDGFAEWSTGVRLLSTLIKLDRLWGNDLVSLTDAVVPLLSEELTTISVLLALLEPPNVPDLLAVVDNKDDVKNDFLFGLDLDVFVEWSTAVGLILSLMKLDRLWTTDMVILSAAVVLLLIFEDVATVSVYLALLESMDVLDLLTITDNLDEGETGKNDAVSLIEYLLKVKFCDTSALVESSRMLDEVLDPVVVEVSGFILDVYLDTDDLCASVIFERNAMDDFLQDCCNELQFWIWE